MMGHKVCFYEEICIIIPQLSLLLLLSWSTVSTIFFQFFYVGWDGRRGRREGATTVVTSRLLHENIKHFLNMKKLK